MTDGVIKIDPSDLAGRKGVLYSDLSHLQSLILIFFFQPPTTSFNTQWPCPVWVSLTCAFRYGREDLDVIGLSFRKDIWTKHIQVYPPTSEAKPANTHVQDALLRKTGEDGHPFTFVVRQHCKQAQ